MKILNILIIILIVSLTALMGLFFKKNILSDQQIAIIVSQPMQNIATNNQVAEFKTENKSLLEPPKEIEAVYVTSWSASSKRYLDYLIELKNNTKINSAVVDIKDWSGYIAYNTDLPETASYTANTNRIKDIDQFVSTLHEAGIYVIGRIAVFQDPILARAKPEIAVHSKTMPNSLWLDRHGLAWIDPASKEAWDYNIAITKDALNHGFDEINFDYVRFPSDGSLQDMTFPVWNGSTEKHLIIKDFFEYTRKKLPDARLSVDLFGLSCVSSTDLGVGQVIEDAFPYFDFISPMVYPSHYASGSLGFENPAEHPYEIIKNSLTKANERLIAFQKNQQALQTDNQENNSQLIKPQIRPWIQDFNLGAIYDTGMVKSEIQAVYDALGTDFNGFMVWNPSNIYTENALGPNNK